jgi:hypothetical protein
VSFFHNGVDYLLSIEVFSFKRLTASLASLSYNRFISPFPDVYSFGDAFFYCFFAFLIRCVLSGPIFLTSFGLCFCEGFSIVAAESNSLFFCFYRDD